MKKLLASLLLLLPIFVRADDSSPYKSEVIGGQWLGLNNADASLQIADNEAQDLLNVDITDNGYGIRKRIGYAQFLTVGLSTHGVRGGHYFRDTSGNDTLVFCNEKDCAESVNSGAFSAFLTTDTSGSYYDWTDANGSAWRANNNRDEIASYNGTTLVYYPSLPKGDQIEFMPDRGAISGTAANPNRITYSKKGDFTNYTVGNEDGDPWTDDIGLPGSVVSAMKYAIGRLFVWTRTSTLYGYGTNQFDWEYKDLSTTIGTTQPNSVVSDQGLVYWQGQDRHFYRTDGNGIDKISRKLDISDIVNGQARSWIVTSQSDFQAGTLGTGLSSTYSPGDVLFTTGTLVDDFSDGDYTASPAWTAFGVSNSTITVTGNKLRFAPSSTSSPLGGIYTALTHPNAIGLEFDYTPRNNDDSRPRIALFLSTGIPTGVNSNGIPTGSHAYVLQLTQNSQFCLGEGSDETLTISSGTASLKSTLRNGCVPISIELSRSTNGFIAAYVNDSVLASVTNTDLTSFSYIGFTYAFMNIVSISDVYNEVDNFYVKYMTATYQSQQFNIGSSITVWDAIEISNTLGGNGLISYAIYGDSNTAITISDASTFVSSQTITNGSIPTIAVAAYATWTATYGRTVTTDTASLGNVTVNWNEGAVTRHFGSVDKDHRILWSVAEGTATVTNVTYIYDTRFDAWLKYGFPMEAPAHVGDSLYFGGVSTGVVYKWPSGNTNAGNAITAYWKSKDFIAGNLFTEKVYKSISIVPKRQTGSNLDITYTVNTSSANAYNISLTDADGNLFVRNNYWLPTGKRGSFFNIKFGNDDGDAPFEVYVLKYEYEPLPWRKQP